MSTEEIYLAILSKPNCSMNNTTVGFIQDLHRYAKTTLLIIKSTKDPRNCTKALILKQNLLYLLKQYDNISRGAPNGKRR